MLLFPLLFLLLAVLGLKFIPCRSFSTLPLQRDQAQSLRGLFAIEIMLGHLGIATNSFFLFPFRKAGILFVGCFFALSGYGLICGASKDASYFSGYWKKRIQTFIIPALLVFFLNTVVYFSLGYISISEIPITILTSKKVELINWYVIEQFAFYFLFWLLYRKHTFWKAANIILVVGSILFIVAAFFLRLKNPWYGSTLCFSLGILYAQNTKSIHQFITSNFVFIFITTTFLLFFSLIAFMMLPEGSFVANVLFRTVASSTFSLLTLVTLMHIRFGNAILFKIGSFSFEIYLLHPLFIFLFSSLISTPILFTCLVIFTTFVIAFLYHMCYHHIYNHIITQHN